MRKNKSKLMAFSLLALCVACLAFGVYALKNATLTVSGTVGFTAHDCIVNVKAYIEGDGITANGTTATDGHPSEERALTFRNVDSNEITVGGESSTEWDKTGEIKDVIYFTDLTDTGTPAPITMTFKLTNLSAYDVYAKIANETDLLAKGVTVVVSDEVVMQESNDTATDEAVLTAIFTLDTSKLDENGLMEGFELKLDFGKYVENNQGGGEGDEVVTGGIDLNNLPQTTQGLVELFEANNFEVATYDGSFNGLPEVAAVSDTEAYWMGIFSEVDTSEVGEEGLVQLKNMMYEYINSYSETYPDSVCEFNGDILYIKSPIKETRTKETSADGNFVFLKDEEGNYTLTQYLGTATEVTLPETAPDGSSTYVLAQYYESSEQGREFINNTWGMVGVSVEDFANASTELWYKTYHFLSDNQTVTTVNIPENVTKIGAAAFNSSNIENINFIGNSKLTHIGYKAFANMQNLSLMILPKSINNISTEAFKNISENAKILYNGTLEEFNANVTNSDTTISDKLYYYSEETPTQEGLFWHYDGEIPTIW